MTHILFVGLGYSALALARQLDSGWRITGTTTSDEGCDRVRQHGWDAAVFDGTRPSPALRAALATATHLVQSAAPDADGDPLLRQHADDVATTPRLRWIGYLSTVGVYGDHRGDWVDETTPLRPVSLRSRQRVAAEQQWLDLARRADKAVDIFRLAGIYGPGRSALDNLKAGTARRIIKPGQVFNRIHVDDIAGVLQAAIARPSDGASRIFNVTDDAPGPPQDVVAHAALLLGLPVPPDVPFEAAALSPMGRSFYGENKRVANAHAKAVLGWRPRYPTYREGLAAILAATSSG